MKGKTMNWFRKLFRKKPKQDKAPELTALWADGMDETEYELDGESIDQQTIAMAKMMMAHMHPIIDITPDEAWNSANAKEKSLAIVYAMDLLSGKVVMVER